MVDPTHHRSVGRTQARSNTTIKTMALLPAYRTKPTTPKPGSRVATKKPKSKDLKISQNTAPMMITPDPKRHQRIKDKERYHEERGDLLCEGCGKWHQQTSLCKECNTCKCQACALY